MGLSAHRYGKIDRASIPLDLALQHKKLFLITILDTGALLPLPLAYVQDSRFSTISSEVCYRPHSFKHGIDIWELDRLLDYCISILDRQAAIGHSTIL